MHDWETVDLLNLKIFNVLVRSMFWNRWSIKITGFTHFVPTLLRYSPQDGGPRGAIRDSSLETQKKLRIYSKHTAGSQLADMQKCVPRQFDEAIL